MKEATGEANMTIITVVVIGLVSVAAMMLIPNLLDSTKKKSCCTSVGGEWNGNGCSITGEEYNSCIADKKAE